MREYILHAFGVRKLLRVLLETDDDLRPAPYALGRLDLIFSSAFALPEEALSFLLPAVRIDLDRVRDHEHAVKTDPELAYQFLAHAIRFGDRLEERF